MRPRGNDRHGPLPGDPRPPAAQPIAALLCALLLGCQGQPPTAPEPPAEAGEDAVAIDLEARAAAIRYAVRAEATDIRILVYRAGRLAELGHNHVISAGAVRGRIYLHPELSRSSFELEIPVRDLIVDDATLRAEEGEAFTSMPSEDDIAATRRNLLGERVLDANRFPAVMLRGRLRTGADGLRAEAVLAVRDRRVAVDVPIEMQREQRSVSVRGAFTVTHRELGLEPFSVLMGASRVAERLELDFRIVAERSSATRD